MNILIFGLPGSGKSTFASNLCKGVDVAHFNGDVVRDMFNEKKFTEQDRIDQVIRMEKLCNMTKKHCVVDFVCPYDQFRSFYDVKIFMNTIESGRYDDTNKVFEKPHKVDYEISSYNYSDIIKEITTRF